jgi:hypothetical protein
MVGEINTRLFEQRSKIGDAVFAVDQAAEVLLENRDYKEERTREMCVAVRYQLVVAEHVAKSFFVPPNRVSAPETPWKVQTALGK